MPKDMPISDRGAMLDPLGERKLLGELIDLVSRHSRLILTTVLSTLAAALLYILITPVSYVAQATLLVEPRANNLFRLQGTAEGTTAEILPLENQIALLNSDHIIILAAKDLSLATDTELGFSGSASTPVSKELEAQSFGRRQKEIIDAVQRRLLARRIGVSSAIVVSYRSSNPTRAAEMANGFVDSYIRDQAAHHNLQANQGSQWLEERIEELRKKMNASTLAVQAARARRDYRIPAAAEDKSTPPVAADQTLEELEIKAATYRKIYEGYIQAYFNSVSQQSFFFPGVRVIARATAPLERSHPRPQIILPLALVGSVLLGLGLAFVYDAASGRGRQSGGKT